MKPEFRPYAGISQLGGGCRRSTWYDFRLASKKQELSDRQERLLNRGHIEELVILNDLVERGELFDIEISETVRSIFKNVFNCKLPKASQQKVEFAHGHGSGHGDGKIILKKETEKRLLEFKTSKTADFNKLKRAIERTSHNVALMNQKFQHYVQVQCYMFLYKLKSCIYIMVCKENDDRVELDIKLDKRFAEEQLNDATKLIFMTTPPDKIGDRNFYMCKPYICKIELVEKLFCEHREVCHNDAPMRKTCRSCKHVEMHDKGRWKCIKNKKFLSFKKQLKACKKYRHM